MRDKAIQCLSEGASGLCSQPTAVCHCALSKSSERELAYALCFILFVETKELLLEKLGKFQERLGVNAGKTKGHEVLGEHWARVRLRPLEEIYAVLAGGEFIAIQFCVWSVTVGFIKKVVASQKSWWIIMISIARDAWRTVWINQFFWERLK